MLPYRYPVAAAERDLPGTFASRRLVLRDDSTSLASGLCSVCSAVS